MDYFAKKQWIRIAVCAVLVVVAVLAMTGVFSGNQPLIYDPAAKNLPAGATTAEATEQGFGGDVSVSVVLDGNTVRELTVDTPNETEGLGKRASTEEFTGQFIGKDGPFTFGADGIEALSGATVTSNAALKAINRAVTGEEAVPETEEKPAEEAKEEQPVEASAEAGAGTEVTEQGFGGDVTVHVTMDGDMVQALSIDTPNETAGLGQRASEAAFTDQFIGKSAPFTYGENGIEALSGATVTSNAVLKAINRAAGAETAPAAEADQAEEPAPTAEEKTADETKTETAASGGQAYGVYRVSKENSFSKVTVIASAKNGKLTDVQILSEGEEDKDLLTDEIKAEWAKAILESGSAAPDAVTGATLTFSAGSVQEAMTEILANMNSGDSEAPAEPAAETAAAEAGTEPAQAAEKPAEEETKGSAEAAASNGQAYGVYRISKENSFSKVTVIASAKNGKLTDVQILSEGEEGKDLLTDEIKAEWAKAILESGSAAPDAVTGATLTFSAGSVQEAMTEILANMNGEATEATAEPAEEPTMDEAGAEAAQAAEKPAEETETKGTTETAASNGQAYGVYRVSKENSFSKVTVIASAKNGKLTDVQILSEGEEGKDLLTDEIKAEWAKAILESGSAAPDAITSATLTFSAGSVQEAMIEILAEMNGEGEAPAAEAEPVSEGVPAIEEEAAGEETAGEESADVQEEPAMEAESEAEETPKAPALYAGYRVDKENQYSKVAVIAYAKNGKLDSVTILSEDGAAKDFLTDEIKAEWSKAILESGNASPDAVTGATKTFSAGSVQEAMTEIFEKAGIEPAGLQTDEPAAEAAEEPAEEPAAEAEPEAAEEPAADGNDLLSLITVSMGKEQENSYVTDYLEQDPYLVNIYEGYGFAKDYGSARGHYYTLTDVEKTQRPHAKANCLTCKTPDMHKMIEEQGVSVYSMPFDEVMAQMTQPISCYTCHGADDGNGGKMVVTHQYVNEALGENVSEVKAASLSCGQCHIEYYFTPEDSEAMMPYHSVAEMTPEAILAYYDELGFSDWEQPGTGTKMLKAQHPELETWSYGKHAAMLSCADCHMPLETADSGVQYHDHHLVSPLESETLLAKCAACHGSAENTIALVRDLQANVTARETEVGNKLSALKDELTAAVSAGRMGEDELDAIRKLHREAQWFFDFCYVENSEGAHNSALAYRCLDTSEAKINEAMGMLAAAGTSDVSADAPAETAPSEEAPAEEAPKAETPAAEGPKKTPPAYAGYRVEKENAFSKITVIAYAKSGKLVSLKILSEGEEGKDLLTDEIKTQWEKAILESQSTAPDTITGATLTFSSGSVQEAVAEILDKAAGK